MACIDFLYYFAWYERIAEQKLTASQKEELKLLTKDQLDYCLQAVERRIIFGKKPFDRKYFMHYFKAVLRNYMCDNPCVSNETIEESLSEEIETVMDEDYENYDKLI